MLKCKSATLTAEGGINTVWEDDKDPAKKYEICIPQKPQRLILTIQIGQKKTTKNEKACQALMLDTNKMNLGLTNIKMCDIIYVSNKRRYIKWL